MQNKPKTCLRHNNIQKINPLYTKEGTWISLTGQEARASTRRRAPLEMRHAPHQWGTRLITLCWGCGTHSQHKINKLQATKTYFDVIKRKYTLTTPYLHVHIIILTPNKQWKPQTNNKIKKQALNENKSRKNLNGKEFTCCRHLSATNLALRDDGLK